MTTLGRIALAALVMATALGCDTDKAAPRNDNTGGAGSPGNTGGSGGAGGSGSAANTVKLETWMDGIAKNGEVDVSTMPDNFLFTVTDKQPVSAPEAAAAMPEPGKLAVVYDEDPAKLRFLFEADPRFEAQ
jgi:hypothetical protein